MQALTKHIILRMFIIHFHGDTSVALQHSNKERELYFPSVLYRLYFLQWKSVSKLTVPWDFKQQHKGVKKSFPTQYKKMKDMNGY